MDFLTPQKNNQYSSRNKYKFQFEGSLSSQITQQNSRNSYFSVGSDFKTTTNIPYLIHTDEPCAVCCGHKEYH